MTDATDHSQATSDETALKEAVKKQVPQGMEGVADSAMDFAAGQAGVRPIVSLFAAAFVGYVFARLTGG